MPSPTPEQRRLIALARRAEDATLARASAAVRAQFRADLLDATSKELSRVLALPQGERRVGLPRVLRLVSEATRATGTPPDAVYRAMGQAVAGRVLSVDELSRIADPSLSFNDSRALQARAVDRQRREMNRYWGRENKRFSDDVARTVRQAIREGLDTGKAADLLQERLGVGRSRALLIAEDQILTAASRADALRQRSLGLRAFLWWTKLDKKVRKEHQALHGRIFQWALARLLPGGPIRCRCRAIPVPNTRRA